jgi:hypothetical protein
MPVGYAAGDSELLSESLAKGLLGDPLSPASTGRWLSD